VTCLVLLAAGALPISAETVNVDCTTRGALAPILRNLKPGDVVVVNGTCRENVLIQPELFRITIDGQGKATIDAPETREPAIQAWAVRSRSRA
jgi:hypothetical protein